MRHRGAACAEETPESVGYPGAKATFDQYPPSGIMVTVVALFCIVCHTLHCSLSTTDFRQAVESLRRDKWL